MSDDLISRKALLDELNSLRIELNGISCRKEFKKIVKEVLDTVKHLIEDQPTAFDKEKVKSELDKLMYIVCDDPLLNGKYINKSVVVKIIDEGGIM